MNQVASTLTTQSWHARPPWGRLIGTVVLGAAVLSFGFYLVRLPIDGVIFIGAIALVFACVAGGSYLALDRPSRVTAEENELIVAMRRNHVVIPWNSVQQMFAGRVLNRTSVNSSLDNLTIVASTGTHSLMLDWYRFADRLAIRSAITARAGLHVSAADSALYSRDNVALDGGVQPVEAQALAALAGVLGGGRLGAMATAAVQVGNARYEALAGELGGSFTQGSQNGWMIRIPYGSWNIVVDNWEVTMDAPVNEVSRIVYLRARAPFVRGQDFSLYSFHKTLLSGRVYEVPIHHNLLGRADPSPVAGGSRSIGDYLGEPVSFSDPSLDRSCSVWSREPALAQQFFADGRLRQLLESHKGFVLSIPGKDPLPDFYPPVSPGFINPAQRPPDGYGVICLEVEHSTAPVADFADVVRAMVSSTAGCLDALVRIEAALLQAPSFRLSPWGIQA